MTDDMDVEMMASKISLYDFPDEVLLPLFLHMNDTGLLNMARVCERFKRIAEEAFAKKYNGDTDDKYYELNIYCENEIEEYEQYEPFFGTFGSYMVAIKIEFYDYLPVARNHWFISLIQRYCTSLAKIHISNGIGVELTGGWIPKYSLTHLHLDSLSLDNYDWAKHKYPQLINLQLYVIENLDEQKLIEFILNNHQIQELHITDYEGNVKTSILESFNGKSLKSLLVELHDSTGLTATTTMIEMRNLTSCGLYLDDSILTPVLNAIGNGCTDIEELNVIEANSECINWNDETIKALCKFQKLKSLELCANELTIKHLKKIIESLPHLSSLNLCHAHESSEIVECFLDVVLMCEKLSYLEILNCNPPALNVISLRTIAEITNRNKCLKIILGSYPSKLTAAQGKVRRGNGIIYWDGYEASQSLSKLTLLNLTNECMEKIIQYLDKKSQKAFYNTCKRTRKAVKEFFFNHKFVVQTNRLGFNDELLECLGKHIRLMDIRELTEIKLWEDINRYCTNLIELTLYNFKDGIWNGWDLSLPNVTKLHVIGGSIDYQNLRSIDCPKLTHLEISRLTAKTMGVQRMPNHNEAFKHLTVLKFKEYNEVVQQFFSGLNENICHQMKELSISNMTTHESKNNFMSYLKLINTLTRFRNLTTLHLLIAGIEISNTRFMFENMPKLIELAIVCEGQYDLKHIRDNCLEIKSIRVIALSKDGIFSSWFINHLHRQCPGNIIKIHYALKMVRNSECIVRFIDDGKSTTTRDLFY